MSQTKAQLLDGKSATIQFTGGSASTPSVSFTGDTNTGIYSPGADQVAISTGGSGQVFVSSNGNLGVGTFNVTNIAGKIHSRADGNEPKALLVLQNRDVNASAGSAINFVNGAVDFSDNRYSYIRSIVTGAGQNGNHLVFGTNANGAVPEERLRITSTGLVGVGTSSPSTLLHIQSTDPAFRFKRSDAGTDAYGELTTDTSGLVTMKCDPANAAAGSGFRITVDNSEALRVDSSGRVGIGTSSPSNLLNVEGSGTTAIAQVVNTSSFTGGTNFTNPHFTLRSGNDTTGNVTRLSLLVGTGGQTYIESLLENGATVAASTVFRNRGADGVAERMRITSTGRVGIGTQSPGQQLTVETASGNCYIEAKRASQSTGQVAIALRGGTSGADCILYQHTNSNDLRFYVNGSDRAAIDSSGRLLVGTSSANQYNHYSNGIRYQQVGTDAATASAQYTIFENSANGPGLLLGKSRSGTQGTNTVVQNSDSLGAFIFLGADGTNWVRAVQIEAQVDGTPGANDMPGRLVFSTTADGASSPTERARITSGGYFKASDNATYVGSTSNYHEFNQSGAPRCVIVKASNGSYAEGALTVDITRAANSAYKMFEAYSGSFGDREYELRGDGNAFADGSWTGGGADYAEYFEWADNNPTAEDRRGISVVLDGDKIREAVAGEDPVGVISGNPSVVGDAAWNKWSGKYLRDEYGTYIQEDYEVINEDGNTVIQQRRKLNPAYNPDVEYISREQRPEWDCVGLMGKLRIRKGQVIGSRWIKMRDINDFVEEWLVR